MTRILGVRFDPPAPVPTAADVLAECVAMPGLYVHIPFCSRICPFCPYNKVPFQPRLAADYMQLLQWEIDQYHRAATAPFTSLYVGGGTPTLCHRNLEMLAEIPVVGERAIEVLPSHMTPRMAAELRGCGFDYASVGVQSFHDSVLQYLQRPTTAQVNRRAVAVAREAFECVDVDLIFDVAYGRADVLLDDLVEAFGFGVDQVSTYPLMRFGYTPFGKARHDRRTEHQVLARAAGLAGRHGYRRDSVWTFVRESGLRYTSITRPYYVGTGAGAASFTGASFAVNHFGLGQYAESVMAQRLPVALTARLPRPVARAYRGFWQAYTGAVSPVGPNGSDALLSHGSVKAALRLAVAAGWVAPDSDGGFRLTGRGYDRYHDLERWVTYRGIEPLWEQMMAEHEPPGSHAAGGRAA